VDVAVTVTGPLGKLDGYSIGLLLLVSTFTALTGCRPLAKVGYHVQERQKAVTVGKACLSTDRPVTNGLMRHWLIDRLVGRVMDMTNVSCD
jgi:hypothetical protein